MADTLIGTAAGTGAGIGGAIGTAIAPGVGTAIGAGIGGLIGAGLGAIPSLKESDIEKEQRKKAAELKRMQELGLLGLTDREIQSIAGLQQAQVQNQIQQAQQMAQGVGASYGVTGAGSVIPERQLQIQKQAAIEGALAQDLGAQDIRRKREQEAEMEARKAAAATMKQERREQLQRGALEAAGEIADVATVGMTSPLAKSAGGTSLSQSFSNIDTSKINSMNSQQIDQLLTSTGRFTPDQLYVLPPDVKKQMIEIFGDVYGQAAPSQGRFVQPF